MTQRFRHLGKRALCIASLSGIAVANAAPTVDLTGKGYVTYGDAQSYSLPIAGLEVMAGPGQINVFTKLGLGANGQLGNSTVGMDDAFDTPQANPIDGFRTGTASEPGGNTAEGSWDRLGWWDSTLKALNGAIDLVKNSVVFFFANNEIGDKVKPDDPDVLAAGDRASLAAWMRVEVSQISTGKILGRYDLSNDFDQDGSSVYGGLPTFDGSGGSGIVLGNPAAYTAPGVLTEAGRLEPILSDFVRSGGEVCIDSVGMIVDCSGSYAQKFQHNLGGDRAAYAIVLPELDNLIASLIGGNLEDYAIHVDYRLGCGDETDFDKVHATDGKKECFDSYALNGGDEKLFLGTQAREEHIPEPSSILLAAAGLAAAAAIRRRRSLI